MVNYFKTISALNPYSARETQNLKIFIIGAEYEATMSWIKDNRVEFLDCVPRWEKNKPENEKKKIQHQVYISKP